MATAKTTTATKPAATTTTAAQPDQFMTTEVVMQQLRKARTAFNLVTKADASPLIWESELEFARRIVLGDPSGRLLKVVPESLAAAMKNLAHVGLTLNPIKQFCTIIARWDKAAAIHEAQVMFMYRGLVYLATQAGVHDIQCDVVYKADEFKVSRRSEGDFFEHNINVLIPRGVDENHFLGAYVAARMPSSDERKLEWVPAVDIFKMRDQSESYLDSEGKIRPTSPWVKWFDEQAKKSAVKRAAKRWEEAIDEGSRWQRLHQAIDLDHKAEGGGRVFDNEVKQPEPTLALEQITAIEAKAKELGHGDVNKYLTKVCTAYGVGTLAEVPATKYNELLERIAAAKTEIEKRKVAKK